MQLAPLSGSGRPRHAQSGTDVPVSDLADPGATMVKSVQENCCEGGDKPRCKKSGAMSNGSKHPNPKDVGAKSGHPTLRNDRRLLSCVRPVASKVAPGHARPQAGAVGLVRARDCADMGGSDCKKPKANKQTSSREAETSNGKASMRRQDRSSGREPILAPSKTIGVNPRTAACRGSGGSSSQADCRKRRDDPTVTESDTERLKPELAALTSKAGVSRQAKL